MDYEYRFNKARAAWNNCYKSAIEHLLQTDERFHEFAMLGLLVCMEEAYRLKTYRDENRLASDSGEMIKMYFGDDIPQKQLNILKMQFVNAMRHQSTLENWGEFNLQYDGREKPLQHWEIMHISDGENSADFIKIYPIVIWNRCAPQIDAFYYGYELDVNQLPKSYGGVVEMWIVPQFEELPAKAQKHFQEFHDDPT